MEKNALREAIIAGNQEAVNNLLAQLKSAQVREELDQNIDGSNHIELAIRLGHRQIAIELLLRSIFEIDEWPHTYAEFTWLKLFEFIGDSTITQFRERLKYAEPLARHGDIDLPSLARTVKFLKIAYQLGAPCEEGKLLGAMIFDALRRDLPLARQRFTDLVKSEICKKFPMSVAETVSRITTKYFVNLLVYYPDWFLDLDKNGNNILHHAIYSSGYLMNTFNHVWACRVGNITPKKRLELAMQKNHAGEIPVILYIKKAQQFSIPTEFYNAIKELIKKGHNFDEILENWQYFIPQRCDPKQYSAPLILSFFLQSGVKSDIAKNFLHSKAKLHNYDVGLFLHHLSKKEDKTSTANVDKDFKVSTVAILQDLPTELICHIIEFLPPSDLVTLSMCSQTLKSQIKALLNGCEQLWKQYHASYFHPVPELQVPHSTFIKEQLDLRNSWYNNKYTTITVPGAFRSLAMDENWLALCTGIATPCYWNCHTHKILRPSGSISSRDEHVLLNNYNKDALPTMFDGKRIIRAEQSFTMKSCNSFPRVNNHTIPIDHRILIGTTAPLFNSVLLNTETDTIDHTFSKWTGYNPFNGTFVIQNKEVKQLIVHDLRTSTVSKHNIGWSCPNLPKFADEYTMFFTEFSGLTSFIDTRTMKLINSISLMICDTEVYSKERGIFVGRNSPLLYSWHLPSRKIEWIEPTESWPIAVNSRYLVTGAKHSYSNLVIRDYK